MNYSYHVCVRHGKPIERVWRALNNLKVLKGLSRPSVTEVIVTEVIVLVAEVNRDKETVLDTKDMVHSTTLFAQASAISGSSAVHKYLFDAEFFKVTWLLLCVVSSV